MSVLVGCRFFDSAVLVADSRVTTTSPRGHVVFVDRIQKVLPLTPETAIGFVGSIRTAAHLLRGLPAAFPHSVRAARAHPFVLVPWLRRYFAQRFQRRAPRGQDRIVHLVLEGTIRDRRSAVERLRLAAVLRAIMDGGQSWGPGYLMHGLRSEPAGDFGWFDEAQPFVCLMRAPDFSPEFVPGLGSIVTGMAPEQRQRLQQRLSSQDARLFGGDGAMHQILALRDELEHFIPSEGVGGVGGLYPAIRARRGQVELHGQRREFLVGSEHTIELQVLPGARWIQRNVTTGNSLELLRPWSPEFEHCMEHATFDDMIDALRSWRPAFPDSGEAGSPGAGRVTASREDVAGCMAA